MKLLASPFDPATTRYYCPSQDLTGRKLIARRFDEQNQRIALRDEPKARPVARDGAVAEPDPGDSKAAIRDAGGGARRGLKLDLCCSVTNL